MSDLIEKGTLKTLILKLSSHHELLRRLNEKIKSQDFDEVNKIRDKIFNELHDKVEI